MPSVVPGQAGIHSPDYLTSQYAGYRAPGHDVPCHRGAVNRRFAEGASESVSCGSSRTVTGRWLGSWPVVFTVPDGVRCTFVTVMAIVRWDRERLEVQYRKGLRCDSWEVVVPELVLEPER